MLLLITPDIRMLVWPYVQEPTYASLPPDAATQARPNLSRSAVFRPVGYDCPHAVVAQ